MIQRLTTSKKGLDVIKHFESLHDGDLKKIGLQPKACPAGWWTVGYGHVVVDPVTGKRLSTAQAYGEKRANELYPAMTIKEAEDLLRKDLLIYERRVLDAIKQQMTQSQFDALVSLDYNTGAVGGKKTVVLKFNKGDVAGAANELLAWNKGRIAGVLRVLPGLTRRRKCERTLFLTDTVNYYA